MRCVECGCEQRDLGRSAWWCPECGTLFERGASGRFLWSPPRSSAVKLASARHGQAGNQLNDGLGEHLRVEVEPVRG